MYVSIDTTFREIYLQKQSRCGSIFLEATKLVLTGMLIQQNTSNTQCCQRIGVKPCHHLSTRLKFPCWTEKV